MDEKEVSLFVTAFTKYSTRKTVSCSDSLEVDLTVFELVFFHDLLSIDNNAICNLSGLPLNASSKSRLISSSNKYTFAEKYHSV